MVDRTNVYGEVVEPEEGFVINTKPFGQPLLLIFLQNRWELMERLGALPKTYFVEGDSRSRLNNLINHCHHIIVYVPAENIMGFVGRLGNISQSVVAIDLLGKNIKSLNIPYKLSFEGKSNNFIFEYLKEFMSSEKDDKTSGPTE